MTDDPIVAEVLATRGRPAAECGYDVEEIVRRFRRRPAESGREYVSYEPQRVACPVRGGGAASKDGRRG